MTSTSSRLAIVTAIIFKDLREFCRDRLWMILTPISLVFMIVLFLVLPDTVNETISLGVFPSYLAESFSLLLDTEAGEFQGLEIIGFVNEDQLADSVHGESGTIAMGIALPADFTESLLSGSGGSVSVYVSESVPMEIRQALTSGVREIAYAAQAVFTGENPLSALPVTLPDLQSRILGEDMAGRQVPLRDRMRPILVIMILLIEALALAGLVSVEIEHRTATALLVTPARMGDFLAAKCLTGVILAVSQAFLFLLFTGGFVFDWLIASVLIFLGAGMASAVGMLSGTSGRDFMSTLFYGMIFVIPLTIPALFTMFPGKPSLIIRLLPSYGLVEAMSGVLGEGKSWSFATPHIMTTFIWDIVFLGSAFFVLRRRVESL
ncbi:MAG: ABC transporter permease [Candidatus Aegiribacteria sp.]|nr:ABC transporter permease [Candidatus Aegiribacteria sp.]